MNKRKLAIEFIFIAIWIFITAGFGLQYYFSIKKYDENRKEYYRLDHAITAPSTAAVKRAKERRGAVRSLRKVYPLPENEYSDIDVWNILVSAVSENKLESLKEWLVTANIVSMSYSTHQIQQYVLNNQELTNDQNEIARYESYRREKKELKSKHYPYLVNKESNRERWLWRFKIASFCSIIGLFPLRYFIMGLIWSFRQIREKYVYQRPG